MCSACFWNPPTWAVSGATVGACLGLSWAILGYLQATVELSWAILSHLGPILGILGAIPTEFTQNLPEQILRNAKFARANFA